MSQIENYYRELLQAYEELNNRILEILGLLEDEFDISVDLGYYGRSVDFNTDYIYVGDYYFKTKWLWTDNDSIIKELTESMECDKIREEQLIRHELAELKRAKEKYEVE